MIHDDPEYQRDPRAECDEGAPGLALGVLDTHRGCPCRKLGTHRVHRCQCGTEWWESAWTSHAPAESHGERPGGSGAGGATPEGAGGDLTAFADHILDDPAPPIRFHRVCGEACAQQQAEVDELRRQVQAVRELCDAGITRKSAIRDSEQHRTALWHGLSGEISAYRAVLKAIGGEA